MHEEPSDAGTAAPARHRAGHRPVPRNTAEPAELRAIVAKLGIEPEQLVRKGEDVYKSKYAGKALSDAQWIKAMVDDPVLIERPIVVYGERAVIGRPPENVEPLLRGKSR